MPEEILIGKMPGRPMTIDEACEFISHNGNVHPDPKVLMASPPTFNQLLNAAKVAVMKDPEYAQVNALQALEAIRAIVKHFHPLIRIET